jgi:ADP-ribose pyrophosphatase YjhB (NUDIX family)
MSERLLDLVRRLHAIARTGLHFSVIEYDRERYVEIERIAVELLAAGDPEQIARYTRLLADEKGYVTPKIDVRGAIFDGRRVLLVRERLDGLWTLPGGWADVNETPAQSILKEIEQDSGYRARVLKLAALLDRPQHGHGPSFFHSWKAFFVCEITGGHARGSYETDAVEFFDLGSLPPMSLGRSTPRQVQRMYEHYLRPELPTEFD